MKFVKKIVENKTFRGVFQVLSLLIIVSSVIVIIVSQFNNFSGIEETMFILGLISAIVGLSYMGLTIYSFQTNKFENVKHLKNNKWIIWIISLGSTILLLISTYQVFCNLQHKVFSQTVGFDQGSYQNAYALLYF